MKAKIIIGVSIIILLIANNPSVLAASAYPMPVEIVQPDGTKITIVMKGDEHLKWAQTSDGYTIMRNKKGVYEYSRQNNTMDIVPSGMLARDEHDRTGSDIQFLSNTPKGLTFSISQVGMMKSITQMVPMIRMKSASASGKKKFLCILVGFKDQSFTKTKADFENLFNQVGYNADGAVGSVYDYYKENSYNQLDLSVTVTSPYMASHEMAYYGANDASGNDVNTHELALEAVKLADPDVNYADFDNDRDGSVDGIYIIHAGYGEEACAPANCIWAHNSAIQSVILDGKIISNYSCSSELRGADGTGITRIGVICHEFGHMLGAMDFYDTNYTKDGANYGTGYWDVMGNGLWNNQGVTPAHHNPYTKIFIYGWATAKTINGGTSVTMTDAERYNNSFYIINTTTPNEFFLCENRQKQSFDSYIPGHGLIIYHVDGNYINAAIGEVNTGSHQGLYPVCANASGLPPATYGLINSSGLPFPGSGKKTSFSDTTTPSSLSWASGHTGCPITGITENTTNKSISFVTSVAANLPAAPTANPAANVFNTGFYASWNVSSSATGYRIDVSTDSLFTAFVPGWNNTDLGNVTTFYVPASDSNTEYYYRIRAYNTGGISANSNTVSLKTLVSLAIAPTELLAVSNNNLSTLEASPINTNPNQSNLQLPSISVYPNPATSKFSVKINGAAEAETMVSILNSAGIKVMEFRGDKRNSESFKDIPVDSLKPGIYFVQASCNQTDNYSSKLIVLK